MDLTWISVTARTGEVIADLPFLDVTSVKHSICRYESATASLPLPTAPQNWRAAAREGGANLILLVDDAPVWGGMVTQSPRGSSDTVEISLATLESYLDRRYVGDVTYTQVGQNAIVADLCERYVSDGPLGGIPLRVAYTDNGTLRDRTYTDASDKTIYSVLTELAAVDGGPEWSIEWESSIVAGKRHYTPVMNVGARIGNAVVAGLSPVATFDLPGCITSVLLTRNYASGSGANAVIATTSVTGNVRPQSPMVIPAVDDGRPTFEWRFTPSTSITSVTTLTEHATAELLALMHGTVTISMTAEMSSAPKLWTDWTLGDDIGYVLGGLEADVRTHLVDAYLDEFVDIWVDQFFPIGTVDELINPNGRDTVLAFPGGLVGTARCIGWEINLSVTPTITPVLSISGELP